MHVLRLYSDTMDKLTTRLEHFCYRVRLEPWPTAAACEIFRAIRSLVSCSKNTTLCSTRDAMRDQGYIFNVTPLISHDCHKGVGLYPVVAGCTTCWGMHTRSAPARPVCLLRRLEGHDST